MNVFVLYYSRNNILTLKGRTIFGVTWTMGAPICPHRVAWPEPAHFRAELHYPPLSL